LGWVGVGEVQGSSEEVLEEGVGGGVLVGVEQVGWVAGGVVGVAGQGQGQGGGEGVGGGAVGVGADVVGDLLPGTAALAQLFRE
jgi:hypothetical protein